MTSLIQRACVPKSVFKRRRLPSEVILACVGRSVHTALATAVCRNDAQTGHCGGPTIIFCRVQRYAPEIEKLMLFSASSSAAYDF